MKEYFAKDIRNVGVFGHGGEGKTSLTEAMLFNAGLLERLGKVENGTTTTDFDPEEVKRSISINAALAPFEWKGSKINVISKAQILYKGVLYTIDWDNATVALAKVRNFGTEDRPTDRPATLLERRFISTSSSGEVMSKILLCVNLRKLSTRSLRILLS